MSTVHISVRVDQSLKMAVERYCRSRAVAIDDFVQDALLARWQELEDIGDLHRVRHEPTRPVAEVLKDLKLGGTR